MQNVAPNTMVPIFTITCKTRENLGKLQINFHTTQRCGQVYYNNCAIFNPERESLFYFVIELRIDKVRSPENQRLFSTFALAGPNQRR